jgi:hypothetical protein
MLKSVVGLILMLHLFSPGQVMQASAAARAAATNLATQRVESGTLKMGAVSVSSGLQTGTALIINSSNNSNRRIDFFVKNFGTVALKSFSLTQTNGETIYYCRGLAFQSSPAKFDTCSDGTPPTVVPKDAGSPNTVSNFVLASALAPGQSHQFAIATISNTDNSISILVRPSNR